MEDIKEKNEFWKVLTVQHVREILAFLKGKQKGLIMWGKKKKKKTRSHFSMTN